MNPNSRAEFPLSFRPVRKDGRGTMEKDDDVFYPDPKNRTEMSSVPEKATLLTPRERLVVTEARYVEGPSEGKSDASILAPKDRGNAVYLVLLIHGIGVLLSWNVLINAAGYYLDYKFEARNITTGNETVDVNYGYRDNLISKLSLAAQVPNLLLNALNLFVGIGGSLKTRIVSGIVILIVIMSETLVLAIVDTTSWTGAFYIITMISVVVMNSAGGVYQNSLYGAAASLPSKYTNAIIIGNNVCGTFIAVLNLLSRLLFPGAHRNQAICYFLIALIILLIALATYFLLPLSKFYRYYSAKATTPIIVKSDDHRSFGSHYRDLIAVFKQVWLQCWNVFFVFFVTLAVFPGVLLDVKIVMPSDKPWISGFYEPGDDNRMFSDIYCFLFFNLFAFIGNLIPFAFSRPGPKWVWLPVLLRVLFIPFFLFCNYSPSGHQRAFPVLINDNFIYIFGVVLLGLSSGYFSSLTMTYAPKSVKSARLVPIAGQMAAFFLVLGISAGLLFGAFFPRIILK